MIRDADYVLKRLDEWNYKRTVRKYTPEFHEELMKKIISSLEKNLLDEFSPYFKRLTRDSCLDKMKKNFTNGYYLLRDILSNNQNSPFYNLPEGVRNEYIAPFFENYRPALALVEDLREISFKKFPDELDDKDIESSMKKVFPTIKDYNNNFIKIMNTHTLPLELSDLSLSEKQKIKKAFSIFDNLFTEINKKLLDDLY